MSEVIGMKRMCWADSMCTLVLSVVLLNDRSMFADGEELEDDKFYFPALNYNSILKASFTWLFYR